VHAQSGADSYETTSGHAVEPGVDESSQSKASRQVKDLKLRCGQGMQAAVSRLEEARSARFARFPLSVCSGTVELVGHTGES